MSNRELSQLELAKADLMAAADKAEEQLISILADARGELSQLLEFVPLKELSEELREEVRQLAELLQTNQKKEVKPTTRATERETRSVKTEEKIDFIRRQLSRSKKGVAKKYLLEKAAIEFGVVPSANFLDTALDDGPFRRNGKQGRSPIYVLAK